MRHGHAMTRLKTAKVPALHNASESFSLTGASDADRLALGKDGHVNNLASFVLSRIFNAELA